MMRNRYRNTRTIAFVLAILGVAAVITAMTASNTVPSAKAGAGAGAISGYTVSAIHYGLNATNPANIDSVTFTLSAAPASGATVKIKLVSAGSTWFSCTMSGTPAVDATCTTTGATVSASDQLDVVVAD
jgi:hypothetical protein